MNKPLLLKYINVLLFISFFIQAITALILFFKFPVRFIDIADQVHQYNGFLFIACVIVHLVFNWDWVVNVLLRRKQ